MTLPAIEPKRHPPRKVAWPIRRAHQDHNDGLELFRQIEHLVPKGLRNTRRHRNYDAERLRARQPG